MSISDAPLAPETADTVVGTLGGNALIIVIAAMWQSFVKSMPEHYKPERHYMRGPGPAYARKYLQQR